MTDSTKQSDKKIMLIGVCGGSGSGKTYFSKALQKRLGKDVCEIVYQDNFYIDQSKRFDFDGGSVNFDHPDSFDFPLFASCLKNLKNNKVTQIPLYDFVTHSRRKETMELEPRAVIVVDGILIFHSPEVRSMLDDLIFFDTPEDLRFQRRLKRDVEERGRTPQGVREQFAKHVKPMHDQFVQPSKKYAKSQIQDVREFDDLLQTCCDKVQQIVQKL